MNNTTSEKNIIEKIENFIKKYITDNKEFLVGFSGGYDSYCLLDIMVKLSLKYKFKVSTCHLNHNIRGEEAFDEQERCKNISKKYKIDFFTETLPINSCKNENLARQYRYEFFENIAKNKNCYVLTAHNFNDNAETLLYRLVKGTGITGLTGIPEIIKKNNITYLRPLLKCSRKEIEQYCVENNLIPNQDKTNNSIIYKRNLIRNKILPELEEINPNVLYALNSLSDLAKENQKIIDYFIKNIFTPEDKILTKKFFELSTELQKAVLHKFCILKNLDYDRKKINEIYDFISNPTNKNKKYSLTTNLWLKFNNEFIYTITPLSKEKSIEEITIKENGIYKLSNGNSFEIKDFCEKDMKFPKETDFTAFADLSKINGIFTLRNRQEGDYIQPFGMNGIMKLKKYLISKKIPEEKRNSLILLASGKEILWVIGVGLSEKLRLAKTKGSVLKYNIK